jgi:hypothetical protein
MVAENRQIVDHLREILNLGTPSSSLLIHISNSLLCPLLTFHKAERKTILSQERHQPSIFRDCMIEEVHRTKGIHGNDMC